MLAQSADKIRQAGDGVVAETNTVKEKLGAIHQQLSEESLRKLNEALEKKVDATLAGLGQAIDCMRTETQLCSAGVRTGADTMKASCKAAAALVRDTARESASSIHTTVQQGNVEIAATMAQGRQQLHSAGSELANTVKAHNNVIEKIMSDLETRISQIHIPADVIERMVKQAVAGTLSPLTTAVQGLGTALTDLLRTTRQALTEIRSFGHGRHWWRFGR